MPTPWIPSMGQQPAWIPGGKLWNESIFCSMFLSHLIHLNGTMVFITWQNSHPSGFWSSFAKKILGKMYKHILTWLVDGWCIYQNPTYHRPNAPQVIWPKLPYFSNLETSLKFFGDLPVCRNLTSALHFVGPKKKKRVLCWLEGKGKIPNPPLCDHNSRIQGLWLLPQWKIQCVFWVAKKWGGFVSDPGTLNTCVFLLSKWWEWTLQLSLYSTRTYEMFGKCSHFLESTLYSIPV